MVEKHNISFFGKDQALIINTSNYTDKIHLTFIQKINNNWQKLSEGLQIAIDINEICEVAEFLEKKEGNVNIIHSLPNIEDIKNFLFEFNDKKDILFIKAKNDKKDILFIKAKLDNKPTSKKFSKPIQSGDLRVLTKLWIHMDNEKIEHYHSLNK